MARASDRSTGHDALSGPAEQSVPARGGRLEAIGAVPNRAIAKRWLKRASTGELVYGSEPNFRPVGERIGDGVGTKFRVLTWRGLLASATAVVVEKETTR